MTYTILTVLLADTAGNPLYGVRFRATADDGTYVPSSEAVTTDYGFNLAMAEFRTIPAGLLITIDRVDPPPAGMETVFDRTEYGGSPTSVPEETFPFRYLTEVGVPRNVYFIQRIAVIEATPTATAEPPTATAEPPTATAEPPTAT
ncbi:MAG: hypothetical protein M3462_07645, partial [Chloroflexota bacterium]|nr:hypothetical protein [Chloroflexota bacterium]